MTTTSSRRRFSLRQKAISAAAIVVVAAGFAVPAYAHGGDGGDNKLQARLTGAKEVPGPGDADGRGKASVRLKQDRICFDLAWRDIAAPTAAHIHVGDKTVAGPVVVLLLSAPDGLGAPVSSVGGCADVDPVLVDAIRSDPRGYYVNIHNADFPAGAIRGQLH